MSAAAILSQLRRALRRGSADVTPSGGVACTDLGLTKLWEELGFMWPEVDDVRGEMSLLLGGVAEKSPRTPQP